MKKNHMTHQYCNKQNIDSQHTDSDLAEDSFASTKETVIQYPDSGLPFTVLAEPNNITMHVDDDFDDAPCASSSLNFADDECDECITVLPSDFNPLSLVEINDENETFENNIDIDTFYCIFSTGVLNKLAEKKNHSDSLFSTLHAYLDNLLYNEKIQVHIYKALNIPRYRFLIRLNRYQSNIRSFRGNPGLVLGQKQLIHDTWLAHANITVDRRNGRDIVNMTKSKYDIQYAGIECPLVEVSSNKRSVIVNAPRYIATETMHATQHKLENKFSYGSIFKYRPFFVGLATEREKLGCLCKICLNARLLFNSVMRVAKEHDDTTFTSISTYFVNGSHCKYGKSGYFDFSCITADCSTCNGVIHPPMLEKTCASEKVITYYQYQSVPYVNKQGKSKSRTEGSI